MLIKMKTKVVAEIIINTGRALEKTEQKELHPEIKTGICKHLIDAQQASIEFAKKLYPED